MVSCSGEINTPDVVDPNNPGAEKTLTVTATFASETASDTRNATAPVFTLNTIDGETGTRVAVTDDNAPKFLWQEGETIPLYVLIKQDGASATTTAMLTVAKDLKAYFKVTLPAGYNFDPARGTMFIAAVTGQQSTASNGAWATGITTAGVATMFSVFTIDCSTNNYNIPLYFQQTPVQTNGSVSVNFKMYGSLVALKMTNSTTTTVTPTSMTVNTTHFGTAGTMNVATLTGGYPTWTGTGANYRTINFTNLTIAPNATKIAYMWVKQQSTTVQPINLTYTDPGIMFSAAKTTTIFQHGMSYRLTMNITAALMITEFYLEDNSINSSDGGYNWLELYNAGTSTIRLNSSSGYALVRKNATGGTIASYPMGITHDLTPGTTYLFGTSNSAQTVHLRTIGGFYTRLPSSNSTINATTGNFIYLTKAGTTIDVVKIQNYYYVWPINHSSTLRRNATINSPNPTFTSSEWTWYVGDGHNLGYR